MKLKASEVTIEENESSIPDEVQHYGSGVDSACNTYEYQKSSLRVEGGRRVRLATSPPFLSK
jgi:hypothetical protein